MKPLRISACAVLMLIAGYGHLSAEDRVNVAIKLFRFQPKAIEIRKGTTVMWENGDAIDHSVTAGEPGKQGEFDSDFFNKGGRFEHKFTAPGTYRYFCRRHANMRGEVVVTE